MEQADVKLLKKYGFEPHEIEIGKDQLMKVNWPQPFHEYRLIQESWKDSIEEAYYWILNYVEMDLGCPIIKKVTDVFSSSEQSAFFGLNQQRLGMQQDKVSSYLAVIGKMTKELFQLVRELRIIDERLGYYFKSENRPKDVYAVKDDRSSSKEWESSEITLKGFWVDLVEQGSKNPSSVYGMAREIQFTVLPDLFFSIHPYDDTMVDKVVDDPEFSKAFNRKLREVLKRKLQTYLAWKRETKKELMTKRTFTLRYFYQHVSSIKLYMDYVRPYLKNVKRLMSGANNETSADLVGAFESATMEVEFIGQSLPKNNKKYWSVLAYHFNFRTKPSLNYNAEGYNRGPIHEGKVEITYRAYAWTQKQIDSYIAMRREEDFQMLRIIDSNLDAAMSSLGDSFFSYLKEAEEMVSDKFKGDDYIPISDFIGVGLDEKKEKYNAKKDSEDKIKKARASNNPFVALVGGFKEIIPGLDFSDKPKAKKKTEVEKFKEGNEKKSAVKSGQAKLWLSYKNYKKSHSMVTW